MATTLTWEVNGRAVLVTLDACATQGFERAAEPTEHAVERGANVTDHVTPGATTITLEGVVTNAPLVDDGTNGARQVVREATLPGGLRAPLLEWDAPFERVRTVDALLDAAVAAGALVTLSSSLRVSVANCVITRYKADRSATIGNAVGVSIELRQVRLVDVRRVQIPDPVQRRGQRQGQRGALPAAPPDNRSTGARLADGGVAAVRRLLP